MGTAKITERQFSRPVIREGKYIRFNAFWTPDGKWNREYLRVCAAHRLFDRNKISSERAVEILKGFVPRGSERAVVEIWRANPRTP